MYNNKKLNGLSATNWTAGERNACSANITARRRCRRRRRRRWGRYVSSDTVTVMTQLWAVELIPAAGRSGQATLKRRAPLAQTLNSPLVPRVHERGARARSIIIYFNWPAAQLYATVRQYARARTHNNNNNLQNNIIYIYSVLCVHAVYTRSIIVFIRSY
jgi:hypothetical protein